MALPKAIHPKDIPAAFYKPIGKILVRWTFTELYMQSIVWHVLGINSPKAARLLTWGLNATDKVKLFTSISPRWVPDSAHQTEVREIAIEADRLRAERNSLAHGIWGYRPGKRKEMLLYYLNNNDKKTKPKPENVDLKILEGWAKDLALLNTRVQKLHRALGAPTP